MASGKLNLSYELMQILGGTADIQTILDTGYKYLNNPIHLTDLTGKLLASSRHDRPVDDIWEGIEKNGYIDYETYQSTCRSNVQKIKSSQTPLLIREAPQNATLLVCGIKTPCHFQANLIVLEHERSFQQEDSGLLTLIATSLSTVLDNHYPGRGLKVQASDYLICDLLDAPAVDIKCINERCKIVSFFPEAPLQILTVCNSKNITSVPILNMTRGHLENLFCGCKTVVHNNRTVTILTESRLSSETFATCPIVPFLKKYGLTASLSMPFNHLKDIYGYYMQTVHALEYGSIVQPNSAFYYYEDYTLCRFLDDLSVDESFCHPCIRQLQEYDAKHRTDYTWTLYSYIMQLCSIRDGAAAMHIHYNTMKYRLGRILELIDLSLEDTGTFLLLYLSFKVLELSGIAFKGEAPPKDI